MANQAFNPDQYLKEKSASAAFDPDAYLQAKGVSMPPANTGQAQTALESFGNGASMGYLPQLQAMTEPVTTAIGNAVTGANVQSDDYIAARDANIARQAAQAKANPYTAMGSGLSGGLATGIASSGLIPAPAASIGGRLVQAGRIGTVYGGLANPGDTQGETNYVQLPQRIENAGKGMAFAAGTAGLLESPGITRNALQSAQKTLANRVGQNVEFTPAPNAAEVEQAAKTLGISSTPKALLTDNPTFQKLESGLSQSGSLPAKGIRDQYNNFFKSLADASKKISDLKTNDSDFSLGKQIQGTMARRVEDAKAPVSEMYNDITPHLRKIEVNEGVVNKAFGALKRNPIFQTKDGIELLNEYKTATLQQPELASLKEFRSSLRDSVSKSAAPIDAKRMDAISSAVTSIRDNTIHALKEHVPAELHPEIDNLIGDISLADAAHKSNLNDLNSVKSLVGNKPFNSQSTFLNKLSDLKESDLAERASNLDVTTLRNLQQKFPPVFDKAKAAIVNDMVKGSTSSVNGFNDTAFLKKYDGLDQEMKDLIFDPKMRSHIEAVKTIKQAIPEKLGPSGTPEGKMMMDMFNPKRNALDYGVKKTLEATSGGPTPAPAIASRQSPAKTALQLILSRPTAENVGASAPFQKAADSGPTKGPDKWANDGLQKLEDHGADEKTLEKVKGAVNEPATKKLLIAASDLKPGSRAMDKILERLQAGDDMTGAFFGQGKFRDTGRKSSGYAEALDAATGAPVRRLLDDAAQNGFSLKGALNAAKSIGTDPKSAPSGYDIANHMGITNPYYGAAVATLGDLAQIPVPGMVPGVVGEVRGVKSAGKIADATEAFAARGKAAASTESRIAQMYGETGEVRDAVPKLIDKAKSEMNLSARKHLSTEEPMAAESQPFWHNENDHSFTDQAKERMDNIVARYGDDAPKAERALKNAQAAPNNMPYAGEEVHGVPLKGAVPFPNYSAKPTGVIGRPGISQPFAGPNKESFPWMDDKYKAARQLLERHESLGMPAQIHTSSDLIAKDGYINNIPNGSTVNLYLSTPDDTLNRVLFPANPSNKRLYAAAQKLKEAGIKTNVVQPTVEDVIKASGGMAQVKKAGFESKEGFVNRLKKIGLITDAEKKSGVIPLLKTKPVEAD